MGYLSNQIHFVLFPFMAQGHLIPMVDIGRLLAQRDDVVVTIITTPHNASRVEKSIAHDVESGLDIRLVPIKFPGNEVGLADGIENLDMVQTPEDFFNFFIAANKMEESVRKLFDEELTPRHDCIISDMCLHYTRKIATKFQVPRISFHGFCCFALLCQHNVQLSNIFKTITSDFEYFTVPGLPDKVEFTKVQLPFNRELESWKEIFDLMAEADEASYGAVINTFDELESGYVKEYKKVRNGKVWCVGPVALSHKDEQEKAERGNKASINEHQCLKWLDSQEPNSVIYACLGSISDLKPQQLMELGLGLEASNKPFIWVLRRNDTSREVEKMIKEDGFEERTKGRGLVIFGWAPQVLILSHPAIGGFLTHCGWNSTIEGISAGVPLITLPLFADQFCNEKLVVQILKIGVSLGLEKPLWIEEEKVVGAVLNKENVRKAIEKVLDEGNEGKERRKQVQEFGEKANKAIEVGGSSYINMAQLIQDIRQQSQKICLDLGPTVHDD